MNPSISKGLRSVFLFVGMNIQNPIRTECIILDGQNVIKHNIKAISRSWVFFIPSGSAMAPF